MKKRILFATAAAVAVTLTLSACGAQSDSASSPTGEPVSGGTLHIGVAADLVKVIPSSADDSNSASIMSQTFEGLVIESDESSGVKPGLASDYSVSDDGLSYTFSVREGVVFHDGTPLTADDVVWSLQHAAEDPNTADRLSGLASVSSPAGEEVVVTLSQPQPDFLQLLTEPQFGIVPADFGGLTEAEFTAAPIGTGPFAFESRAAGLSISFVKNDDYWGDAPYLDGIEYQVYKDVNSESLALQSGEIDMVDNAGIDSLGIFQGTPVAQKLPATVELMIFNSLSPVLSSADLRRAISMAIDRSSIVDALTAGYGVPATSILTEGAYPEGIPAVTDSPYVFNADAATQLVADSNYDGTPLKLIYSTGRPIDVSLAQILEESLSAVGVTVELSPLDSAGWLSAQTSGEHSWDISITKTDGATASSQLGFIAGTDYLFAGWPTDDVDTAIAEFNAAATDTAAQQSALAEYTQQLAGSSVLVPMIDVAAVSVLSDSVKGFTPRGSQYYSLNGVWLAE